MAKNYPSLYANTGYAIALEQKMLLKVETARGTLALPAATDFLYHTGGSVNFSQPIEDSPHKSGRHKTGVIKGKTATAWTLTTLFNIDTSLGAKGVAEIDPAIALLFEAMFGTKDVTGGSPVFTSLTPPSKTFTLFEIGDIFSKQSVGCFVESCNMTFPGDGRAQMEWAGQAKTAHLVGIGKSVTLNAGNTVTVAAGEGRRFPVGAKVMIVDHLNVKSADTPAGSARTVMDVTGEVVTLDGAVLADADGSGVGAPVYLCYYEPEAISGINDPQTGLVGSFAVAGESYINCVRSIGINCTNNAEIHANCFGEEGLGGPLFSNGGKLNVEVTAEVNLSKDLVGFINDERKFEGQDLTLILGDAAGRHLEIELPKVVFSVSEVNVPETGTIPVTLTGAAEQTVLDLADEITISFL